MRRCPSCAETFGDDLDVCPADGTALEPVEADAPEEDDDLASSGALLTTLHAGDTGPVTGPAPKAKPEPADGEELAPGTLLGGVYEVVRKVGQGGMGAVYEVEHKRMQKRYAAKVLRRDVSANKEYVQRLEREAVAATRIEHPNIVRVVNLDETDDGQVFLIMEYLEGEDLSHLLGEGRLAPAAALTIGIQVATALHKVHERGIVHRDLKPENIFLAQEDEETVVKLLDFGISKLDTAEGEVRLTKTGCVMGTPLYMSPEHAKGEASLDRRADVYSLGVILYESLVGRPPFEGTQTIEVMLKHVSETPEAPSRVTTSLPEPLDELVLKSLEKEPAARYQTLAEFAAAMAETGERIGISRSELPEIGPGRSRSLESLVEFG